MELVPHSFSHSLEKCCSSGKNDVLEKILSDVSIAFHHRVKCIFVNSFEFELSSTGLEQNFWAHEPFMTNNDLSSIWKVVIFIVCGIVLTFLEFLVEVFVDNVAKFFFNVSYNFKFCWSCEVITSVFE